MKIKEREKKITAPPEMKGGFGMPPGGMPMGEMPMGGAPPGGMPPDGAPMGGMPPGGAPPGGMPMGGMPGEIMRTVTPDFAGWRKKLYWFTLSLALLIMICEAAAVIFCAANKIEYDFVSQLILPSGINAVMLLAGWFLVYKTKSQAIIPLNVASLSIISIVLTVASAFHYSVTNIMTALCLPILISVVYYLKPVTLAMLVYSLIGITVSTLTRFFTGRGEGLVVEALVSLGAVFVAEAAAQVMNIMLGEQRSKLTGVVSDAVKSRYDAMTASRAKTDFLANMSHEIRTPINAILGMNEMILREEKKPTIRDYALNIQASGNLLLSLINDVLDISKIESGQIEITPTVYDAASLINDCYNMSAVRAQKKNLELRVNCDENLPHMLKGDEVRVRQIIVNLLTNGIKYTETGSVTLSVSGERKDGVFLMRVSVADTGIGISEENIKELFHQFKRVDLNHNRNIEGTGLGLTIVKHFVDLMDGNIFVQSKLGEGSVFTIEIPQKIVDDTPVGKLHLSYSLTEDYSYTHSFEAPEAHILAVDDLHMNLIVIKNMLKETKVKIDLALSGAAAIELCEQNKYDLILMDHMMPEMDGVQTFGKLRSDRNSLNRDTPVIMLTANALAGVRERYMDVGFTDYLSKPVRGKKLEETILKYLPHELVTTTVEQENEPAPSEDSVLAPLVEALPQLNTKLALQYCCESVELFIEILKEYSLSHRREEMEEQFKNGDFDGYRVNAHSLKSTSLTVGLEGLSERARASEFALRAGDVEFVKNAHNDLMELYSDVLNKIRLYLSKFPN